jgi:sugar phosphate isomerase/epimerase
LRISLSTASLYVYPLRHVFALAKDVGFEGLELALSFEARARGSDYVHRLSLEYSLPIHTLHPPMIPTPKRRQHHQMLPELAAVAHELECEFIIIHAPKAAALSTRPQSRRAPTT